MLIRMVGQSVDGGFTDKSEGKKEFGFDQDSDDSVIV